MSNGRWSLRIWSELGEFEQRFNWQQILFWFGLVTGFFIVIIGLDLFILTKLRLFDGFVPSEDTLTGYRYLLSATAQVLAALFALVFSITLIVTQLATKYTQRAVGIVFDKRINIYIGGFALAVVFPLMWIITPMWIGAIESVVIGVLYVLSLPFLFIYFIRKMKIEGVIAELKRFALEAIIAGKEERAEVMINALDSIALGALNDGNYEVFEFAETSLTELLLKLGEMIASAQDQQDQGSVDFYRSIRENIMRKLGDTCREEIDTPRAPVIIIRELGLRGAEAARRNLYDLEFNIAEFISTIAKTCKKETRTFLSIQCFISFHFMMSKHPDNAPLIHQNMRVATLQDYYINYELLIFDIHLREGWTDWLEYLYRSFIEYLSRFRLKDWLKEGILISIWITAVRLEGAVTFEKSLEDLLHGLWGSLWKKEQLENFLNEKIFNLAVERGKGYGIDEETLHKRWEFLNNYKKKMREYQRNRNKYPPQA